MKCQFHKISSSEPWETFQCSVCLCVIEARVDVSQVQSLLDNAPPCGEIRTSVQAAKERAMSSLSVPGSIRRYSAAILKWIKAGRPKRPWDRVEELFATACGPCPKFRPWKDGEAGGCTICGCHLSRHGAAYKNKLRMATEGCPASPPRFLPDFPQTAVAVPPENG